MAFKDNWGYHITAFLTGNGLSNRLAQDFWSEDLFNQKKMVPHHLLKMLWVYGASAMTQVTLPCALIMIPITFYKNGGTDWTWNLIVLGGTTIFGWAIGIVAATATWLDLKRKARV